MMMVMVVRRRSLGRKSGALASPGSRYRTSSARFREGPGTARLGGGESAAIAGYR